MLLQVLNGYVIGQAWTLTSQAECLKPVPSTSVQKGKAKLLSVLQNDLELTHYNLVVCLYATLSMTQQCVALLKQATYFGKARWLQRKAQRNHGWQRQPQAPCHKQARRLGRHWCKARWQVALQALASMRRISDGWKATARAL
jgi:hypothetical protein